MPIRARTLGALWLSVALSACAAAPEVVDPDGGIAEDARPRDGAAAPDAAIAPADDAAIAPADDAATAEDASASEDATGLEDAAVVAEDAASDDGGSTPSDDAGSTSSDDGGSTSSDDGGSASSDDAGSASSDDAGSTSSDDGGSTSSDDAGSTSSDAGPPADGGPSIDFTRLDWSVRAVIDPRLTLFGRSQLVAPRNLRSLALTPDGRYLYAGYLNGSARDAEIRKLDLTRTGTVDLAIASVVGLGAKALALDDAGRVYVAGETDIHVLTSSLTGPQYSIPCSARCEGVAVVREAGALVLYSSDRDVGSLERRVLGEAGGAIVSDTLDGLGGNGILDLDRSGSLRNVRVDPLGRIWVVAYASNRLYRVSSDGSGLAWVSVQQPFDLGFDGPYVIVSHNLARSLTRVERDSMLLVAPAARPPWATLGLDPLGQSSLGALTGLAVVPDVGFFVAHESGTGLPFFDPGTGETLRMADAILWATGP